MVCHEEEGLAASRCDCAETRGADETDVQKSTEQHLLKWSYTPNAIVDHHFDELTFLLIGSVELRIIFSSAFSDMS